MKVVKGNVLDSEVKGIKLIPHVCNDRGGFGSGFAYAVAKKYVNVQLQYFNLFRNGFYYDIFQNVVVNPILGQIQILEAKELNQSISSVRVANMIAQSTPGGETINGIYVPPIRYECLRECMLRVAQFINNSNRKDEISIHAPFFGCGLAGGTKDEVLKLVDEYWSEFDVTFYEYGQ